LADYVIDETDNWTNVTLENKTKGIILATTGTRDQFLCTVHQSPGVFAWRADPTHCIHHLPPHPLSTSKWSKAGKGCNLSHFSISRLPESITMTGAI
jgi:hypothetical protein